MEIRTGLRDQDIHKIVDTFNNQVELLKYSRMVPHAEIEANEFNLNIPRYIDSQEPEDIQDIEAHLLGGIPVADIDALGSYWDVYPSMKSELFKPNKRKKYLDLKISNDAIKQAIYTHPEFTAYQKKIETVFKNWSKSVAPKLEAITVGDKPKLIIREISESLLDKFSGLS
jgi:type I restriction enzyme M protein